MTTHRSAAKRVRTSARAQSRNSRARSRLKSSMARLKASCEKGDREAAEKTAREAMRFVDLARKSSVIHRNQAARRKSTICRMLASLPSAIRQEEG